MHRLLAVPAEAGDAEGIGAEALIARLLQLTDVLALWRASSEALGRELDGAQAALVASVDAQNATLQRMLYDAGVTREQLDGDRRRRRQRRGAAHRALGARRGAALAAARRRQPAQAALARRRCGVPHPGELAAWFAAVAALDAPAAAT